ncbi:MAG TPA: ABC transporter ATP-binding protein [Pyrinomonadaceae bacterium]
MMKPIMRVENLGKKYSLGAREVIAPTLREALVRFVKNTAERFSRGRDTDAQTVWALSGVTFEVYPGEVVGVIGRNGAGKSTLLKILSRITKPTMGLADLYGRTGSLLEVGTGFHPDLTGRENIHLNGAILGMKREEISRKFDEIVAFAEVDRFLDTPVKRYSTGMYLRLAFAVAAHLDPEILLLDEVLTVGDALFQKKCFAKMKEVGREGKTVLFVSHNTASVQHLCGRALYLRNGVLSEEGKPDAVIASYLKDLSESESAGLAC